MVLKGSGSAPQAMFWKLVGVLLIVRIITGGGYCIPLVGRAEDAGCPAMHKHSQTTKNHPPSRILQGFQRIHCTSYT